MGWLALSDNVCLLFFNLNDKVSEYKVKVKVGDKDLDETIKIDTKEETELFHIASNGDTNPDAHERVGGGKVDVLYDFKQVSL